MSTAQIFDQVMTRGIALSVHNGKIRVEAPEEVLTSDIQDQIRQNKPKIIRHVTSMEKAVLGTELSVSEVYAALDHEDREDWFNGKITPAELHAFAVSIVNRRLREQGKIPAHYTAITHCQGCGDVPMFEGAPKRVLSCPWCFNRLSGKPHAK